MAAYQRKTRDEFDVEQKTCQGWEVVCTEDTRREAIECVKEYRMNQPEYPVRYRGRRIKIEEGEHA